jgi:hypothetical protein
VRWPPASVDVSPGAVDRPLLEDVTKQCSEFHNGEHRSVCDRDSCSHELCVKVSKKSDYQCKLRLQSLVT